MRRHLALLLIAGLAVAFSRESKAQIQFDRVYPPIVSAGSQANIVAEGKFPNWPPKKVSCERDDVQVTAEKDSGKLSVKALDSATPGVVYLRMFDSKSASSVVPLLITRQTVTLESEPNNQSDEANKLVLPTVVAGELHKNGEVDTFRFSLKANDRFVASVVADEFLKSPMDPVLQLADQDGNVLCQSDDARGLDPQIVYQAIATGDYWLRVFAFPKTPNSTIGFAGGSSFHYAIQATTGPFLDHATLGADGSVDAFGWNLSPDASVTLQQHERSRNSLHTAFLDGGSGWSLIDVNPTVTLVANMEKATALPAVAWGHFGKPSENHEYRFATKAGVSYTVESRSKADGLLADTFLTLVDAGSQKTLADNDDLVRGQNDSWLHFKAKSDGETIVRVKDLLDGHGPRHAYELTIRETVPQVRLRVQNDHFEVKAGEAIEIPVTVIREKGFSHKVKISLNGLPKGLKAEATTSEAKGSSSKSVKVKLVTEKDVQQQIPISIVGTIVDSDSDSERVISCGLELAPRLLNEEIWVTVWK